MHLLSLKMQVNCKSTEGSNGDQHRLKWKRRSIQKPQICYLVREARGLFEKVPVRGKKVRQGKNAGPHHTGLEFLETSHSV